MALWFECKAKYEKLQESGVTKVVAEPYLVDALTFTEAESRFIEELTPGISGVFSVSAVKKTRISEIFFNDEGDDRFYKVKVNFSQIDERTGSEKKITNFILVQASSFDEAYRVFLHGMRGTMADFEIAYIAETPIVDVFPLKLSDG